MGKSVKAHSNRALRRQSLSQMANLKEIKVGGYRHKQKSAILSGLRALGAPADT